jgi:sialate O-acetylesterase
MKSEISLVRATGLAALGALVFAAGARAELALPHLFTDHMVLQQGKPAAVWGQADPGARVKVRFADARATAKAGKDGAWKVFLGPLKANAKGADLTVKAGKETKTIHDVLVGEVWVASGQSNMDFQVGGTYGVKTDAKSDITGANHPGIRMFTAGRVPAATPQKDIGGSWIVCSPETVARFSAVAYYFALDLHKALKVPVGVIWVSWGGKPVETFTSREALAAIPEGRALLEPFDKQVKSFTPQKVERRFKKAQELYQKALADWEAKPKDKRGRRPRPPSKPANPALTPGRTTVLYNGMIAPCVGYTMRGAIWYQGESNAGNIDRANAYRELFEAMITDWRKRWNDNFAFLFVQLANFKKASTHPGAVDPWALVQDEQRKTLELPNTGMAVINDIGETNNIHPKNKKDVGKRLARWALHFTYGKKAIVPSGPLFKSCKIEGDKVRVFFAWAKGLKSRDGKPLHRFEIAGADKKWHWAEAKIDGESVVVSSPEVPKPVAVRYAWASNPEGANLVNGEGLPASEFRTDDWEK